MRMRILLSAAAAVLILSGRAPAAESAKAAEAAESPIKTAAQEALWNGDFKELERQNALFRQPGRSIAPDGQSQLNLYRDGIDSVFDNDVDDTEAYLKELDALTLRWATEHPDSALAHILHAKALTEHGWSYRGGGYVKDVPREAWKDFHAYLERAANYLKAHADVALTDSSAHLVLLRIGRGLGWPSEQMVAIANDGLKRNPDDLDLTFQVMGTLLPKWGGNADVLDAYINQVTAQTRAQFGMGMYARLYASAAINQYGYTLFQDTHADWRKIRQGYDDLLARYPGSPMFRNRYAFIACIAKDKATAGRLLGELGTAIDTSEWGSNPERSVESCRRWAAQK